jgi:hypothetical protein
MPGCIVSATTASFDSVEKRRRRATPVITSTFENVSDIGIRPALFLGPPAIADVRSKRGALQSIRYRRGWRDTRVKGHYGQTETTTQRAIGALTPLAKLADPHPVDPLGDHDLGMLASRQNTPARPCQRTASPARHVGLIRAGRDPARTLLRWLAFRGTPPGNRCLPDKGSGVLF